ncbi:MAG: NlpC/P60 family protein [Spirochaetota bacterium]
MSRKIIWFLVLGFMFQSSMFALDLQEKKALIHSIRWLAAFNIKYGRSQSLPGSTKKYRWDCSGTAQFLYKKSINKAIPRTSYDQYLSLKTAGKIKSPPLEKGRVDVVKLKTILKSGDLLFWTNTHDAIPTFRKPPIGHVMIYLGTKKNGIMLMGGSNTWGKGYLNKRSGGGPDIYEFNPNTRMGCAKRENPKNRRSKCLPGYESKFIGFGQP